MSMESLLLLLYNKMDPRDTDRLTVHSYMQLPAGYIPTLSQYLSHDWILYHLAIGHTDTA